MGITVRQTIEIEIDGDLLQRAADAGVDLTTVLENAIRLRLPKSTTDETRRWNAENRDAIEASNAYVAEHGLPLAKYRMF